MVTRDDNGDRPETRDEGPVAGDLAAPSLLIAMPQVLDPFFERSVVLLLHQAEEGSYGFIINRPTELKVTEILEGMEIPWRGREDSLAFFGGPVQPQVGTILFAGEPPPGDEDRSLEALPGVRLTQHVQDLSRLAEEPPESFRLLLGYAGWGAGQLVGEILRNDWIVAPVDLGLLFPASPDTVWEQALSNVGVDAATLPAWTTSNSDDEPN